MKDEEIKSMAEAEYSSKNKTQEPFMVTNEMADSWCRAAYIKGAKAVREKEGWISVKDKVPEYYKTVLVFCSVSYRLAWRASDGEKDFYTKIGGNEILSGVTHWKELLPPNS